MRFHTQVPKRKKSKGRWLKILLPSLVVAIVFSFYYLNAKLTPVYMKYAEVQTRKIAAHVISQAIQSRSDSVLDVNDVLINIPNDSKETVTMKVDAETISQIMAEIHELVEEHLDRAESGDLAMLPDGEGIDFDTEEMEKHGGVVFFVPIGQVAGIPLLGNLGPKIPIRFHIIGDVHGNIDTKITEYGINNVYMEVNIILEVNVEIIIPVATKQSTVEHSFPVAIGIIQGVVPQIYTKGGQSPANIEVPMGDTNAP
ncbi:MULTISPECIES: sporulation protein YunB [Sporosarcina]|uniref:sporulation protein YunB n=1 Tax=Sporosarcina TaxID=1569 RepID=UPI00059026F5|nr:MULTISPECIES: sporulation protein YunB [Sporosarcina]WJY27773.1 sporulation protein YunB [Sporosarcina sp. 0.2-SM1T-5]